MVLKGGGVSLLCESCWLMRLLPARMVMLCGMIVIRVDRDQQARYFEVADEVLFTLAMMDSRF